MTAPNVGTSGARARVVHILHRILRRRESRFLMAGAYNTAFGYIAFVITYHFLGQRFGEVASLALSYVPSLANSYATQRYFVFRPAPYLARFGIRAEDDVAPSGGRFEFAKFAVASTIILVANLAFLPLLVRHFGVPPVLAQALFLIASTVASYLVHKSFSFRSHRPAKK